MEENTSCFQSKPWDPQFRRQLDKIDEIQRSVSDMQAHIRFLLKRDEEQNKKTQRIFNSSVRIAENKIKYSESQFKSLLKAEEKAKKQSIRSSQVREMRERDLNNLEQTRRQISNFKENQRNVIREMSKKNDFKLKCMREEQQLKNKEKAQQIKQTHTNKIKEILASKEQERQRKQEDVMKKSFARLTTKAELEHQLAKLKEEQKQINKKLEEKKKLQEKIMEGARKISKLDKEKVIQLSKKNQSAEGTQTDQENMDVECSLIQKALINSKNNSVINLRN